MLRFLLYSHINNRRAAIIAFEKINWARILKLSFINWLMVTPISKLLMTDFAMITNPSVNELFKHSIVQLSWHFMRYFTHHTCFIHMFSSIKDLDFRLSNFVLVSVHPHINQCRYLVYIDIKNPKGFLWSLSRTNRYVFLLLYVTAKFIHTYFGALFETRVQSVSVWTTALISILIDMAEHKHNSGIAAQKQEASDSHSLILSQKWEANR